MISAALLRQGRQDDLRRATRTIAKRVEKCIEVDGGTAMQSSNCLCTERSPKKSDIQRTRCCMYTMNPPDDEHNIARNM